MALRKDVCIKMKKNVLQFFALQWVITILHWSLVEIMYVFTRVGFDLEAPL